MTIFVLVTLFGAIGSCLRGGFVHMLGKATTCVEFERFLLVMAGRKKDPRSKPWLVADRHTSHTSDKVAQTLEKHFRTLWTPTYR